MLKLDPLKMNIELNDFFLLPDFPKWFALIHISTNKILKCSFSITLQTIVSHHFKKIIYVGKRFYLMVNIFFLVIWIPFLKTLFTFLLGYL